MKAISVEEMDRWWDAFKLGCQLYASKDRPMVYNGDTDEECGTVWEYGQWFARGALEEFNGALAGEYKYDE